MGRKIIDKVFDVVVRMDITVRVHADTKDEAELWVNERFMDSLLINDNDFMPLEMRPQLSQMIIKKVKRARRVKLNPITTAEETNE